MSSTSGTASGKSCCKWILLFHSELAIIHGLTGWFAAYWELPCCWLLLTLHGCPSLTCFCVHNLLPTDKLSKNLPPFAVWQYES